MRMGDMGAHEAGVGWLSRSLETWLLTRPSPQRVRTQELFSPSQANLGMRCVTSPHWCHRQHISSLGSFQIFTIYVITPERHYGFPRIFAITRVILQHNKKFHFQLNYSLFQKILIINKCLNTQDGSSRLGRWVCLSDQILTMLSIPCLWHTLGMTEWLLTVYLSWRRWHRSWDRRPKTRQTRRGSLRSKCCVLEWLISHNPLYIAVYRGR